MEKSLALSQLRSLWSQALAISVDEIKHQSIFFTLGGDSFSLLRLAFAIEDSFGVNLTPEEMIDNCSLESMSNLLCDKTR